MMDEQRLQEIEREMRPNTCDVPSEAKDSRCSHAGESTSGQCGDGAFRPDTTPAPPPSTGVSVEGADSFRRAAEQEAQWERAWQNASDERDAAKAEVTRLYDELGRVSEELGLPRSIGPAPGWLKQQMSELSEARRLLATRVEADRLSEANDEIARLGESLTDVRRVLREVERAGWLASCPCCGWNVQHRDTCALAAVLAQDTDA